MVQSSDGLRIAMVAERKGWIFPRFAEDDVIQHCIEEALMARIDVVKAREAEERHKRDAVKAAEERAKARMEELKRG